MLVAGIVCLMGAVVGGGLKAFQIELPLLQSRGRQAALGSLGVVADRRCVDPEGTAREQRQGVRYPGIARDPVIDAAGRPQAE